MKEETEEGVEHVALVDYLLAVPVRGLAWYLPCFGHQWAFGRCTWMNSRDTCWDTRGMFGVFGFGFFCWWYLVLCYVDTHSPAVMLAPVACSTICTSFTASKVGGRGRSQRFFRSIFACTYYGTGIC